MVYTITKDPMDGLFRLDKLTRTKRWWWFDKTTSEFVGYFPNYMLAHMALIGKQKIHLPLSSIRRIC